MVSTNINIRADAEVKAEAQRVFEALGLDMTTAINLFLRQTVREGDLPFVLSAKPTSRTSSREIPYGRGSMKGKMWVADDFDDPIDDFAEYVA
ncbi:MAG: type II toxin-antitoxin system RelB/DinJ family antitoxin [Bifidobacteriaceae bacterium]|jgi:DNA-damage-inducible protein J|nr:type II toxin-antitoxin system RelB/DinJ family antitoxin [Bifidobacteriaceae bacterium]